MGSVLTTGFLVTLILLTKALLLDNDSPQVEPLPVKRRR